MTPSISLIHATYGRAEKAVAAMRMFRKHAENAQDIEYIFACESDDPALPQLKALLDAESPLLPFARVEVIEGSFGGSAPAWDAAARVSTGAILFQMQDDLECEEAWDFLLTSTLAQLPLSDKPTPSFFISVSDGYRKDALLCTAICSRRYYEFKSEFLHAGYLSVFSDDEFSVRAYADAADGVCVWIKANHLTFLHRHAYHDKSVPLDDTYMRENRPEAYAVGLKLFLERNSRQLARGFRTW